MVGKLIDAIHERLGALVQAAEVDD
jgi:hypothetical protein